MTDDNQPTDPTHRPGARVSGVDERAADQTPRPEFFDTGRGIFASRRGRGSGENPISSPTMPPAHAISLAQVPSLGDGA
jgi:hypothetical protein